MKDPSLLLLCGCDGARVVTEAQLVGQQDGIHKVLPEQQAAGFTPVSIEQRHDGLDTPARISVQRRKGVIDPQRVRIVGLGWKRALLGRRPDPLARQRKGPGGRAASWLSRPVPVCLRMDPGFDGVAQSDQQRRGLCVDKTEQTCQRTGPPHTGEITLVVVVLLILMQRCGRQVKLYNDLLGQRERRF